MRNMAIPAIFLLSALLFTAAAPAVFADPPLLIFPVEQTNIDFILGQQLWRNSDLAIDGTVNDSYTEDEDFSTYSDCIYGGSEKLTCFYNFNFSVVNNTRNTVIIQNRLSNGVSNSASTLDVWAWNTTRIGFDLLSCHNWGLTGGQPDNVTVNTTCIIDVTELNGYVIDGRLRMLLRAKDGPVPYNHLEPLAYVSLFEIAMTNASIAIGVPTTTTLLSGVVAGAAYIDGLVGMVGGLLGSDLTGGKFIVWMVVSIATAVFVAVKTDNKSWVIDAIVFLSMFGLGVVINWIPAWVGIAIIIVSGLGLAATLKGGG